METLRQITIFIGSPSDTIEERVCVSNIIDELNQTIGQDHIVLF